MGLNPMTGVLIRKRNLETDNIEGRPCEDKGRKRPQKKPTLPTPYSRLDLWSPGK